MAFDRRSWSLSISLATALLISQGCEKRRSQVLPKLPDPALSARTPRQYSPDTSRQPTAPTPPRSDDAYSANRYLAGIPAAWYPPVADRPWKAIVVHHSASDTGDAASIDRSHRNRGWDELGYHFVIGNGSNTPDGLVEVGSRWRKQKHGAHCKTPDNYYNDYGIGICLVGNCENHPPTAGQMASLKKLLVFLTQRYALTSDQVYGHRDLKPTECPGRFVSVSSLRVWLQGQGQIYAGRR